MSRVGTSGLLVFSSVVLMAGCGGSCPQAAASGAESSFAAPVPSANADSSDEAKSANADSVEKPAESTPEKKSTESSPSSGSKPDETPLDPTFPEHASVAEATRAVPQGTSRANINPERLGQPLQSSSLYDPCAVGAQHFKLRVAVWNGHAVGVDVVTPNKKLAACVDQQVRGIQWPDKVRSLNTVDFSM